MQVLIKYNSATELHTSNGSTGRLVQLVDEDEEQWYNATTIRNSTFPSNTVYIRKPLYALVQLPQCKLASALTDLLPTLVPIVPEQKTIKIDLKSCLSPAQKRLLQNKTTITITRCQLPLIPAYALTTHKCQGKTLESGVIDIVPPPYAKPDLAQTYVPISRFKVQKPWLSSDRFLGLFWIKNLILRWNPNCGDCSQSIQLIEQGSENNYETHMLTKNAI